MKDPKKQERGKKSHELKEEMPRGNQISTSSPTDNFTLSTS